MGLLDSLFSSDTYSSGGGILDFLRQSQMQQDQYQPSAGFPQDQPPANFADRFNAMPGAPQPVAPSGRSFDSAQFDPQTFVPNQAQPIAVGNNYQMPRIGDAGQFQPSQAMLPPNAQPAQGQLPQGQQAPMPQQAPQAPQELPPAFGGTSYLERLNAGGGLIGSMLGDTTQQKNLAAQYHAIRQVLITNGENPQAAASKAMVAVMNPEAAKTIIPELFTNKQKYTKTGTDALGSEQYGFVNERDQTVNGKPAGQVDTGSVGGFFAPGVKGIDSSLTGQDYLKQFSPEVQAAVQNYIEGKSTPTGNPRKGFTQTVKMIAQKVGADTGQQVDDTTFAARRQMRNQLSSSAPSSLGGQINIGNTAAGHLADLTQKALELGNYDTGIAPLSHAVNAARGLGTEQAAKMEALKGAAQHYGQEITKFYAGSPGGVAERDRFIESVNGARSPKELAAILATEGELMRSRLDALGGQIKGVLGEEGTKQYPVLRPDGEVALKKVEENVSKLKGGGAEASKPAGIDRSAIEAEMRKRGLMK